MKGTRVHLSDLSQWDKSRAVPGKPPTGFSMDAIYVEPPDKQLHRSREALHEFFGRYHGIVAVKIEAGLIKHWREYQYRTVLGWEQFTSHNPF